MIKNCLILTVVFLSGIFSALGQLSIEECYRLSENNYPLIRNYDLILASRDYDLRNASRGYLPQISISSQASYQTDVTSIPFSFPGVVIPKFDKDQYRNVIEATQIIWDGGAIRAEKSRIYAESEVEMRQYEVDIYSLRSRINDLYFGILIVQDNLSLTDLFIDDLLTSRQTLESYLANGVANQSDIDAVDAEYFVNLQRRAELTALKRSYVGMLSLFVGFELPEDIVLELPDPQLEELKRSIVLSAGFTGRRPEMSLFDANAELANASRNLINARDLPKVGAFIQGGYSSPGLDMFSNGFKTYAIYGVQLSWNFGGLYKRKNDLRKIDNSIARIDVQRDVFEFNNKLALIRQLEELEKYENILSQDDNIVQLRENVRRASEAKLENGVISVNDLVRDMNAEQSARQNRALHQVELIKAAYDIKYIINE